MRGKLIIGLGILFLLVACNAGNITVESISYEPAPAKPGKLLKLWIQVKNDSKYDANNVIVKLDVKGDRETQFPFEIPDGNNVKYLGSMKAYSISIAKFNILVSEKAPNGEYKLHVLVGEGDALKQREISITVQNIAPNVIIAEVKPIEVAPGEEASVEVKLANIGKDLAYNVMLLLEESEVMVPKGNSSVYIGNLAPGEEKTARIEIVTKPDTELGAYEIPLKVVFKDREDLSYENSGRAGLEIYEKPELDASLFFDREKIKEGKCVVTLEVYNASNASAKYVLVELEGKGIEFQNKKYFIGTLEPDDFDTIDFECQSESKSAAKVDVLFNYYDEFGNKLTQKKDFELEMPKFERTASENKINITALIVSVLIVFITAVAGYKIIKRLTAHD